jgi:GTP-binding protein
MAVGQHHRRAASGVAFPTVAIVGRPNVGKSTLFNRILGQRIAIVAEQAGVTRDRQFAEAEWNGRPFLLIDTGGILDSPEGRMDREIRTQVLAAVEHADAVLFVVDARAGLHPIDRHVAELLRRSGRPTILAANKVDELSGAIDHYEFFELGLGAPGAVSALSGKGSGDLLDQVVLALPELPTEDPLDVDLRVAVIGRPTVGKSSFVNMLLGEQRVIVHEEAGTTRDAIDTYLELDGTRVCLIDTAGLRRQSRVDDEVEFYGRLRATMAIRRADVCLLLVDSEAGAANQDFRIGHSAWEEGCGLVFVANKWDLIEDRGPKVMASFERQLRERAHYLRWVPIVTVSAKTGQRVRKALEIARGVQENRSVRIPTAEVNRVLERLVSRQQPAQGVRGEVRLRYGSQVGTAPPVFVLWSNRPDEVKENYLRYLKAGFRSAWGFEGSPIRIKLKKRSERR